MTKMMRMAMMTAAMFTVVTGVAKAQGGGMGGGRGGRGMNPVMILKDSLHVSESVAMKADSIYKAYQAESRPLMEASRGGDADARTKMMAARTKMTADIKGLLTEEQKAQFDKMMPTGRRGGSL